MFLVDMQFQDLAKITPELTAQHRSYLQQQYQSGQLLFGGRKVPRTGGLLISRHASAAELQQVLEADPFRLSGAVSYTITEFVPVMAADEYANLLGLTN